MPLNSFQLHKLCTTAILKCHSKRITSTHLECLLLCRELALALLRNLEALLYEHVSCLTLLSVKFVGFTYLGRVQNGLDLLE